MTLLSQWCSGQHAEASNPCLVRERPSQVVGRLSQEGRHFTLNPHRLSLPSFPCPSKGQERDPGCLVSQATSFSLVLWDSGHTEQSLGWGRSARGSGRRTRVGRGNEDRLPTAWPDLSSTGGHGLLGVWKLTPCFREPEAAKSHRGKSLSFTSCASPRGQSDTCHTSVCLSDPKPSFALTVTGHGGRPLHGRVSGLWPGDCVSTEGHKALRSPCCWQSQALSSRGAWGQASRGITTFNS